MSSVTALLVDHGESFAALVFTLVCAVQVLVSMRWLERHERDRDYGFRSPPCESPVAHLAHQPVGEACSREVGGDLAEVTRAPAMRGRRAA